ncbi:sodium channel protein PaFPC1-like isoform X3 [Periplaneta americana]|uniref:sodium channel protein PaFPC1-like isoform X3 n=1 Tax=Periplaneta americana TaxID=6978 RepID=UPI0037E8E0D5
MTHVTTDVCTSQLCSINKESLATIEDRIQNECSKEKEFKNEDKPKLIPTFKKNFVTNDESPKPDHALQQGKRIPFHFRESLTPEHISVPVEDIDSFYENQSTFVVINRRKFIFRFSARNALWILDPFNPVRRFAIFIVIHPLFSFLMNAVIIINCIALTQSILPARQLPSYIFIGIFSLELVLKVVARGFLLEPFTYLRDPWTCFDFVLIILDYMSMILHFRKLDALRILRILRSLKTIEGAKSIVHSLFKSIMKLWTVVILFVILLSTCAVMGLQMYMGVFTQKCIRDFPWGNLTNENWFGLCNNKTLWYIPDDTSDYLLCGNTSGSSNCPPGYVCLQGFGDNPTNSYTSFDTFGWAFLSVFRVVTNDSWERLYRMIMESVGPWHTLYFIMIILCSASFSCIFSAIIYFVTRESEYKIEEEENVEQEQRNRSDKTVSDNELLEQKQESMPENLNDGEDRSPALKMKLSVVYLHCRELLCVWECCWWWLRFQDCARYIACNPFFKLFIVLCILANLIIMALFHYNMEKNIRKAFMNGRCFLAVVFATEAMLKIISMSPYYYFKRRKNVFDFIVTALCCLELGFENVQGLSLLWSLRLLRIFQRIRTCPSLSYIVAIMLRITSALGYITFLLIISTCMFSILGMQLFGKYYYDNLERFPSGIIPRANFSNFYQSVMTVLRVLHGKWIESMKDCTLIGDWTCAPFFLIIAACGKLLVPNIIFAFVITTLHSSYLCAPRDDDDDEDTGAFEIYSHMKNIFKKFKNISKKAIKMCRKSLNSTPAGKIEAEVQESRNGAAIQESRNEAEIQENENAEQEHREEVTEEEEEEEDIVDLCEVQSIYNYLEFPDCCPTKCYTAFPFLLENEYSTSWKSLRKKLYMLNDHAYYKRAYFVMCVISSLTLIVEDVNLSQRPVLQDILQYMDLILTVVFLFHIFIQLFAIGVIRYLKTLLCLLELCITTVSFVNFVSFMAGKQRIQAFRAIQALRILALLKTMNRFKKMRSLTRSLSALPLVMANCLVPCFIIWHLFAVVGVLLFAGKHKKCVASNSTILKHDYNACIAGNYKWESSAMNFDNVGNAHLVLCQIDIFKTLRWILEDADDPRNIRNEVINGTYIYTCFYIILFYIFSNFAMSLIAGIVMDNYEEMVKKMSGALETCCFHFQEYSRRNEIVKRVLRQRPRFIRRPKLTLQVYAYEMCRSKKCDTLITFLIGFYILVIAFDHYRLSEQFKEIIYYSTIILLVTFSMEVLVKVFAFRHYYFKDLWNIFDLTIVVTSITGLVIRDRYLLSLMTLRTVRVAKMRRVLRHYKIANEFIKCVLTLSSSLTSVLSVCFIFIIVMFLYAIFGMTFFARNNIMRSVDGGYEFKTFGQSMVTLFQMTSSNHWNGMLEAILAKDACREGFGSSCVAAITGIAFVLSYTFITYVLVCLILAVVLYFYSSVDDDVETFLTIDEYSMYNEIWQNFDPDCTQYIHLDQLSEFLDMLELPLRIGKPNKFKIISMDIPICKDNLISYEDVLSSVTKNYLNIEDDYYDYEYLGLNSTAVSSTLWRQRENYCAKVIQNTWRKHRQYCRDDGCDDSDDSHTDYRQATVFVESNEFVASGNSHVMINPKLVVTTPTPTYV